MSSEKMAEESRRWLRQAHADLRAARSSRESGSHEWASFQAQQSAEKALKALWYHSGHDPWGHSITKLIMDFPAETLKTHIQAFIDDAKALDKLYIPTRYPNGLPEMIPAEVYTAEESRDAIARAEKIISCAVSIIPE